MKIKQKHPINGNLKVIKLVKVLPTVWDKFAKLKNYLIVTNNSAIIRYAIAIFSVTGCLITLRHFGAMQPLELAAYDQMVRLVHHKQPDPRLLVIAITETDIREYRWPLSDRMVAQILQKLQQHHPKAIGLDLYRDSPQEPGRQLLQEQLKKPNVIVITDDAGQVLPPASVPRERIGFNDFAIDPDSVIRRSLLFMYDERGSLQSFSLRLAQLYLADLGIYPQGSRTTPSYLQLGKAIFVPLTPDAGGYQNIDARGYQILLSYRSPQQVARQITLEQFLNGKYNPSWVKDKVVIIGSSAPRLKDLFLTPYSPSQELNYKMPGVLVHTQLLSQIISVALGEQRLFWFWPEWAEILWILAWATIGGSLAATFRHPLLLSILSAIVIGICLLTSFFLFTHQRWVPIVSPVLSAFIAGVVVVVTRAYASYQEEKIVMKLLGKNTSPQIAAALWQNRDRLLKEGKLPGQTLTATLLFSDIKDFSTIAEQIPPELLLDWLNEYFSAIAQEVQAYHGIINKFTGDGIMAAFGVPMIRTTPEDIARDAYSAVACALAMSDRLQELNINLLRRGLPTIQMRVGIYTGPVVAGSLGYKDRLEYGIIGDSVNIASRLESCCKERQPSNCRILIAQETLVHILGQFKVESWGPIELKGRRQTVEIYRVISKSD